MNNTVEFIDAALLPQLAALMRSSIKYNGSKPLRMWVNVLPQATLQADGDLKITALAIPSDLAHQISGLIQARLSECHALTHGLMQQGFGDGRLHHD